KLLLLGVAVLGGGGEVGKEKAGSQDSGVDMRSGVSSSAVSTNTTTDLPLQWSRKAAEELFAAAESNALSRRTSKVAEGLTYMEKLLLSKYRSAVGASADSVGPSKPPTTDHAHIKTEADLEMGDTDSAHQEVLNLGGASGGVSGSATSSLVKAKSSSDKKPVYGYYDLAGSSGSEPESEGEEVTGGGRIDRGAAASNAAHPQGQLGAGMQGPGAGQQYYHIEDVTGSDEQVFQGALRTGRVLEMVGPERMRVEEPE
ncbi:hypothetical protein HK097_010705, partial [Rhizophlyctis rosea]